MYSVLFSINSRKEKKKLSIFPSTYYSCYQLSNLTTTLLNVSAAWYIVYSFLVYYICWNANKRDPLSSTEYIYIKFLLYSAKCVFLFTCDFLLISSSAPWTLLVATAPRSLCDWWQLLKCHESSVKLWSNMEKTFQLSPILGEVLLWDAKTKSKEKQ